MLALFGQCFVETGGRRSLLKLGDAVHVGDTVDVEPGAKLKLRMNDGSVIAVASGGRLRYRSAYTGHCKYGDDRGDREAVSHGRVPTAESERS